MRTKAFKNHIHNTLQITKQDIRDMVQESVEKIVERKLDVMFSNEYATQHFIDKAVRGKVLSYWGESEDTLDDYIKKQVVRELLKNVKLKVEIAKTKGEATPEPELMQVRRRKHK